MFSPRRTVLTAAALFAASLLACSCVAQDGPTVCSEMRALVNGDSQPPPELGGAASSVVGLRVRRQVGGESLEQVCSGVRIDDHHVLTAAHCFKSDHAEVALSMGHVLPETDDCAPLVAQDRTDSVSPRLHPQRDIAVVTTHASLGVATPVCAAPPQPGIRGIVAGYGLDENARLGTRRFLFTRVVSVSDDAIEVRATTEAGACVGDSGGPLFVEQDGAWCVVGILSTGSASCRASDRYVPLLPLSDWLR